MAMLFFVFILLLFFADVKLHPLSFKALHSCHYMLQDSYLVPAGECMKPAHLLLVHKDFSSQPHTIHVLIFEDSTSCTHVISSSVQRPVHFSVASLLDAEKLARAATVRYSAIPPCRYFNCLTNATMPALFGTGIGQ